MSHRQRLTTRKILGNLMGPDLAWNIRGIADHLKKGTFERSEITSGPFLSSKGIPNLLKIFSGKHIVIWPLISLRNLGYGRKWHALLGKPLSPCV